MRFFKKKYSMDDLEKFKQMNQVDRSAGNIILIDDNVYPIIDELRRHDYIINRLPDVERIDDLKNYHIVISDIKGVGKFFGSKFEGAHLIEEIHKKFPMKYLIAYSSSTFNPTFNQYFSLCDVIKRKNIDIQEWVVTLDNAIKNINDPVYQWEKIRAILVKNRLPIELISKIENSYIKSVVKKDSNYLIRQVKDASGFLESPIIKIAIDSIKDFALDFIIKILKK
jgi:hypothetical protein